MQLDGVDLHSFWNDDDVRWLAGVNEANGVTYVNKERFEELTDLLQLPALLDAAGHDSGELEAILEIEAGVEDACDLMSESGYRLDSYLESQIEHLRSEKQAKLPTSYSV